MFKWINKLGVESDKGFIVKSTGRFTREYIEDSKKIIINVCDEGEHPNGQFFDVVKSDNFEKWEDGAPISSEKQEEIKRNFIEGMAFQQIDIIIDDSKTTTHKI